MHAVKDHPDVKTSGKPTLFDEHNLAGSHQSHLYRHQTSTYPERRNHILLLPVILRQSWQ